MRRHVFPTAPSPTVTHLINLVAAVAAAAAAAAAALVLATPPVLVISSYNNVYSTRFDQQL